MTNGQALLTIPARMSSSTARHSQYVSASAQSVGITAANAAGQVGPFFANVSAGSSLCGTTSGGARTCAIPVFAPPGSVTFTFALYDAVNGGGNVLGTGSITQTVAFGTSFNVAVAVNGVVASLAIAVSPTALPVTAGTTSTATITATAKDADGNTIIGPGNYAMPIALTNSDTSGATSISPASLTAPGQTATLTYNGASSIPSSATVGAQVAGIPAIAISSTVVTFSGTPNAPAPASCGTPVTLPGTYSTIIATGTYSSTTFTANISSTGSSWFSYAYTAAASPSPGPSSTLTSNPNPNPTATRTPQPIYDFIGTYQLQSGSRGCFVVITSQDGSPLSIYNGTSLQGASGIGTGGPNVNPPYNVTSVASGTLTSLVINNLGAGGGSGTVSLSNGDTGTVTLTSRLSSSLDEARKLIEQMHHPLMP